MSAFDSIGDSTASLRTEGQEIKLSFKPGLPTTGQATVDWTLPAPARGCTTTVESAYAGIVIILSTEPLDSTNIPQDGIIYIADPTANFDLSTADRIGDAIVIGSFYECEKKSRGEALTTTFVINDLLPNTAYYVAGYAVDCQNRYHSEGIRSYSDMLGKKARDTAATQIINLGLTGSGVLPTDGTGLVPGVDYEFDIIIDDTFPEGTNVKTIEVTIDGINAGTYQDLLDNINNQIMLFDNPPQSPSPPNSNSFFWNPATQELFQFNGVSYDPVITLIEPTDPSTVAIGAYWYDETNKVLNRWNVPSPTGWNVVGVIESLDDPKMPVCGTYWYDNNIARIWNGTTWCDSITISSVTDPSICPVLSCGEFWYDETNALLLEWNINNLKWDNTAAIVWPQAPNLLSNGTYWYDDVLNTLSIRVGAVWNDITSSTIIQETEPTAPSNGLLWYNPSTEELREYSSTSPVGFTIIPVLIWPEDPTVIESCELWWDSINDILFTWDVVNATWDQVVKFTQSVIDPSQALVIEVDTIWYNPVVQTLLRWDGSAWLAVASFIIRPTDPTVVTVGEAWFNTKTNIWSIWDIPAPGWNVIDPINSLVDPFSIVSGTYWYDTTNNALFVRNGVVWSTVLFTTVPVLPTRNSLWYDSTNNVLNTWNGNTWVPAIPCGVASFNDNGGFIFTTIGTGSNNVIIVPAPENSLASTSPCAIGTGFGYDGVEDISYAQCSYYDNNITRTYDARDIPDNSFLWSNLSIMPNVLRPVGGNDDISGEPTYATIGVGDDGSPDERRELMDTIRAQLGYPVVEVELTNYQIDTAIDKALESFRKRSSASVKRGFFFIDIEPQKQQYLLSNKVLGYNRIVSVMAAYRFNSAFLSSAAGAGVYGQVVLQHLYNMGTYDLTSFFLVSQYIEQLEELFATRLTFGWHEYERVLSFYSSFVRPERVLLDCMVERTEQDLMSDRITKSWIEKYALSESMMILAQIRGKFASLPGAGGGISLNAGELMNLGQTYRDELMQQIDDNIATDPHDTGMVGSFILG